MPDPTLRELRTEFGQSRFLAMPIAGTIAILLGRPRPAFSPQPS